MKEQPSHSLCDTISKNKYTEWGIKSSGASSITNFDGGDGSSDIGESGGKSSEISTKYGPLPNLTNNWGNESKKKKLEVGQKAYPK
jgi:hypothetical protein